MFQGRTRGAALIICFMVISIVSVMGLAMMRVSSMERNASTNFSYQVQTKLLAEAGFNRALTAIPEEFIKKGITDWSRTGWVYRDGVAVDVRDSTNPSYSYKVNDGKFTYRYRVKVVDANSLLNINDPNQIGLKNMLANLCGYLGIAGGSDIAKRVIDSRPSVSWDNDTRKLIGGYRSIYDMQSRAAVSDTTFNTLSPYLTAVGWTDTKAAVRGTSSLDDNIVLATRVPLNINAAPWQIIAAALCGIKALDGTEIPQDTASSVALAIVNRRKTSAFANWADYKKELTAMSKSLANLSKAQEELIFLATVPNGHSYRHDTIPWYYVYYLSTNGYDTSSIQYTHTNFSLGSFGFFHIESLGDIIGPEGVVSDTYLCTSSKVCNVYRHTTQSEFEKARTNLPPCAASLPHNRAPWHDRFGGVIIGDDSDWELEEEESGGSMGIATKSKTGKPLPGKSLSKSMRKSSAKMSMMKFKSKKGKGKGLGKKVAKSTNNLKGQSLKGKISGNLAAQNIIFGKSSGSDPLAFLKNATATSAPPSPGSSNFDTETIFFRAPNGSNPANFKEKVTLPDGAIQYKKEIGNPPDPLRAWMYFRYEQGEFRCSSLLIKPNVDVPLQREDNWDIVYGARLRPNWKSTLEGILRQAYIAVADTVADGSTPPNPSSNGNAPTNNGNAPTNNSTVAGSTEVVYHEEEFLAYAGQIFGGIAHGTMPRMTMPLLGRVDVNTFEMQKDEQGNTTKVLTKTETLTFNVTDYLNSDYLDFWPGMFDGTPRRVGENRGSEIDLYVEGVPNSGSPDIHDFDRARWEKRMPSPPLTEGRIYKINIKIPYDTLEVDFDIEEMPMNYDPEQGKFVQGKFQPLPGDIGDYEPGMGSTINVWYGPDPYDEVKAIFPMTTKVPHNKIANVYEGIFRVVESRKWRVATAVWTGYTPVKDQKINVSIMGQEVQSSGEGISGMTRNLNTGNGTIPFRVQFDSLDGSTPIFEDITLFTITEPEILFFQYR